MADSEAFEWTCSELERLTPLDRLETRGTLRLALKQGGLEAATATAPDVAVVVEKILPSELNSRGVADADSVCAQLRTGLESLAEPDSGRADSPEAIFQRLGR